LCGQPRSFSERPRVSGNPKAERLPIISIDLWDQHEVQCGICEKWGPYRHAVAWYCEPVRVEIGAPVPEWGPDAIAMGRTVCKPCHDEFYEVPADAA
jgi:hypothetical protein